MSKKISLSILAVVIAILIVGGIFWFWPLYQSWRIGHAYRMFEQGFLGILKEDTYGGKTPQETYEMFVGALKKGDLEEAGKYFYWEYQIIKQEKFEKMRDENKLEEYITNLPKWEEMTEEEYWDKDGKRYSWNWIRTEPEIFIDPIDGEKLVLPVGKGKSIITFQLNKQANIWKIYK